ncbi:MAG: serine/threonine-protein kinase, partial [Burkholderiales bacterium]
MVLPEKIGKYEIQGVLGRGGMGVVYKGFDAAIARGVAIKVVTKSSLDPEELKHVIGRFRHEARAVGRLVHPRIVQIYDYGEDDQIAYIVMELVNGKTLKQHLSRGDSYEIRESGEIIRQLLDGIGHAHGEGVVHRDIKPSNIMINNDGRIKIGDFGIARTEASGLTQAGDVLGTLHYMAPEQFLGAEVDALADL